jgi:hypothetical protein
MPETNPVYTPSRGYEIEIEIGNIKYNNDLIKVRIVSSISSPYPLIFLTINLDENDITLKRVYGKEPIKMTIRFRGRKDSQNIPIEDFKFELLHLSSDSSFSMKPMISATSQKQRSPVTFITVPRLAFKTITSIVNDVFENKTPKQIIEEMATSSNCKLEYDSDGENAEAIDQIIIPPMSMYKAIKYLDNYFGLFNGASNLGYCTYDNILKIMNLTKRPSKNQKFTVYQVAQDDPKSKDIIGKCFDGSNFYTQDMITSTFSGNERIAALSKKIYHVVRPKDKLYSVLDQDMIKVCQDSGFIEKNKTIDTDSILDSRETYITELAGNENSLVYAEAQNSRDIVSMATIKMTLEKNIPVLNLMSIGECVKVITKTMEFIDLSGKYYLKSSDILFTREAADWICFAKIALSRTNKTI